MKRRSTSWAALAVLLLAAAARTAPADGTGAPSNGTTAETESPQAQFVAAMLRVSLRQPDAPDSPALQGYVIYDYLVAARLRRDLGVNPGEAVDTSIAAFLAAHAGQPVSRALRHDWLASLAARHRWNIFLAHSSDVGDAPLACDRLDGRLATGDTAGLKEDALARWSLPQRQPAECDEVFGWLRAQGLLTPALAEARTRAALAADNARAASDFVSDVPAPQAAPLLQWIRLLTQPQSVLTLLAANPAMPVEPDALVAGFAHLCSTNIGVATTVLPSLLLRPDVTPVMRTRMRRAAALGSAYSRLPGAVAQFTDLPVEAADTQAQEWRVRAALWAADYATALRWIDEMQPALAAQPRWRYWHARAVAALSGRAAAAPLYAEIAGLRDFYGYLAADRLEEAYHLNIHPSPDDLQAQAELAQLPALRRAHALFDCDLADDAASEWAAEIGGAKPAVKVQAAHLASNWGWYAETIATLAQAGEWDDVLLRYPRPYAALVAQASQLTEVPGDWLFAVMRQESLFRKDAVSRADARGLMQMLPATATAVARRWHLPPPTRQSLFDPAVAVPLGAAYVRELLDKYRGQLDEALAAYNAGPLSVARWQPANPVDADVWIENIPYTETRGYVEHILEHIVAFAAVRDATPPRLSTLMPKVGPSIPPEP